MQTDNYVDFLLPIDIRAGVFMSLPDNIKAKSVPTRTFCNCSLVSNLSLWYLYLLSDLHWRSRLLVQQTEKKTLLRKCIYCFQPFHSSFFKNKTKKMLHSGFFHHSSSKLRGLGLCGLFPFEDKNQAHSESQHILHRHPIDKEKQANKGIVIIYNAGAAGVALHLTADQSRSFSWVWSALNHMAMQSSETINSVAAGVTLWRAERSAMATRQTN